MQAATTDRAKLQALVDRAEALLKERTPYFTDGAKLALTDMLEAAKRALEGHDVLPFRRNREFYTPREEEAIRFATRRFTMVPPFDTDRSVFTHYGLEPALKWMMKQDMMYGGKEKLLDKANLAIGKAKELLGSAKTGTGVGEYDAEAKEKLEHSLQALERLRSGLHTTSTAAPTGISAPIPTPACNLQRA